MRARTSIRQDAVDARYMAAVCDELKIVPSRVLASIAAEFRALFPFIGR